MEPPEECAEEWRKSVLQSLFLCLQAVQDLLDLFRVKPLIVFPLRSELELLWLSLTLDELLGYFKLIPVLSMTPIDPP